MALNRLQQQLESIYEIRLPHQVEDFLITDVAVLNAIEPPAARPNREKLLINHDGDTLNLSLYLDAALLENLSPKLPNGLATNEQMAEFCLALEGVSHFVYVIWSAMHDRKVTLLELELQAEIDKYVTLAKLFSNNSGGRTPPSLRAWLFEQATFADDLSADEAERYRAANFFAGKFCRDLEALHRGMVGNGRMLQDLRRFYRLGQAEKLELISNLKQ